MSDGLLVTLNAGSSSVKFALYEAAAGEAAAGEAAAGQAATGAAAAEYAAEPVEIAAGQVSGLGPKARLTFALAGRTQRAIELGPADHGAALDAILAQLKPLLADRAIIAVGHRIAHGGLDFVQPCDLDSAAIDALTELVPLAPLHQPHNLAAVAAARRLFPDALQVGCFDTAFHRQHPWVNDTFALPRRFYEQGIRRYGFHGLSYDFVTDYLRTRAPDLAAGRVVIAHLGNGASMCAVKAGQSVASTMGFSALDGLAMGTRCGQLDPGVLLYLMEREGFDGPALTDLLYRESGLKGLSGISHDMRTLEASDAPEAAEAIDYFVFRIRRELGAMAAVLGGIDAFVFCGGIGENAAAVRARVCEGMDWLGIEIDEAENRGNASLISTGRVKVLVVNTDEERVIARAVVRMLKQQT